MKLLLLLPTFGLSLNNLPFSFTDTRMLCNFINPVVNSLSTVSDQIKLTTFTPDVFYNNVTKELLQISANELLKESHKKLTELQQKISSKDSQWIDQVESELEIVTAEMAKKSIDPYAAERLKVLKEFRVLRAKSVDLTELKNAAHVLTSGKVKAIFEKAGKTDKGIGSAYDRLEKAVTNLNAETQGIQSVNLLEQGKGSKQFIELISSLKELQSVVGWKNFGNAALIGTTLAASTLLVWSATSEKNDAEKAA